MIVVVKSVVYQSWHNGQRSVLQQTWINCLVLSLLFLAFAGQLFELSKHFVVFALLLFVYLDSSEKLVMLSFAPLRPDEVASTCELITGEHLVVGDSIWLTGG